MKSDKSRRNRGKRQRRRTCGTKVPYGQEEAVRLARALTRKSCVKYNAYKCPFCYLPSGACAWHVGHAVSLVRRLG